MQNEPDTNFTIPDPKALEAEKSAPSARKEQAPANDMTAVLKQHHDQLMQIDGVVMIGEGQDELGQPAILVGVKAQHHLKSIPKAVDGVRIVGMVIGDVDALGTSGGRR